MTLISKLIIWLWAALFATFAVNATASNQTNYCEYFPQVAQSHSKTKLDGQLIRMGFQYP